MSVEFAWLGAAVTLAIHALFGLVGLGGARRLLGGEAPAHLHVCAAMVLVLALEYVVFMALASVGLFTSWVVSGAMVAVAALLVWRREWSVREWASACAMLSAFVEELREAHSGRVWRLGWFAAASLLLLTAVRETLAPPMGWDEMTYQLVRPGMWVQEGRLQLTYHAPGAWTLFETREPLGNIISAWAIVVPSRDTLNALAWFGVLSGCGLGAYSMARAFGASARDAAVVAWATALTPALISHGFMSLVDNVIVLLVCAATAFVARFEREGDPRAATMACLAFTLTLLVKKTSLPFVGMGGLCLLAATTRHRRAIEFKQITWTLAACAALLSLWFGYMWHSTGNPLFPYTIEIGGRVIFEGGPIADGISSVGRQRPLDQKLLAMFYMGYEGTPWNHVNFGALFLPMALLSLPMTGRALGRVQAKFALVQVVFAAWFAFAFIVWSPTGSGLNEARYAAASIPILLMCSALFDYRGKGVVWGAYLVSVCVYALPVQFGPSDWEMVFLFGCICALGAALGAGMVRLLKTTALEAKTSWGVAAGLTLTSLLALEPTRDVYRHTIYVESSEGLSYSNLPVSGINAMSYGSAVFFEHLDQDAALDVAVTAGWDLRGINWFIYPLMGSSLQNTLHYVTPLADGSNPVYKVWEPAPLHGAYKAWLGRLDARSIDYVVTMAPLTIELVWMHSSPDRFEFVEGSAHPHNRLYRVLPRQDEPKEANR